MSYALLIVEDPAQRGDRTEAEGREVYQQMVEFAESLGRRGLLGGVQSLSSHHEASRVRVRDGKASVLDGPFAEAKEMVGGFFLLEGATREQALAIAAECPAARWCTVEVRRVAPCYE